MKKTAIDPILVKSKSRYSQLLATDRAKKALVVTMVVDHSDTSAVQRVSEVLTKVSDEFNENRPQNPADILFVLLPVCCRDNGVSGFPLGYDKVVDEVPSLHFETANGRRLADEPIEGARLSNTKYVKAVAAQALRQVAPRV